MWFESREKWVVAFAPVLIAVMCLMMSANASAQAPAKVFPGADESTPSYAHYFDWINSQYEGSDEAQSLTNLAFFKWMHDEYGMQLDIYALDVGNIDDGPYTAGVGRLIPAHYGSLDTPEFRQQFPHGFDPLVKSAASFGCRMGVWMGPDGYGNTPVEAKRRTDMLIKLCRDHNFILFKLDSVAGELPAEHQQNVADALRACREYCPDLIAANHRVDFGIATPYITTSLWEGAETYIDVFSANTTTATHHRAGALARGLPPKMTRLLEDHGVCLSSCLDYWDDELVLQAFNRGLLLSPSIYGNPWFLRDDEYPKLARLFNLKRRYRDILISAKVLPEEQYGPSAVARGDGNMRFVTLRNLTWEPVSYRVQLDDSIGLSGNHAVDLRRLHPSERILGSFDWGSAVDVKVLPFRSCLLVASVVGNNEIGVVGTDYEVERDVPGKPVIVKLLGMPGTAAKIQLAAGDHTFQRAELDGKPANALTTGGTAEVQFAGMPLTKPWHRRLATLQACDVPADAEALYEAACYATDSNALEVRCLDRSGPSDIPAVQAARETFLQQKMFVNRGIWDRNLFDGDLNTHFVARLKDRALRVDFGTPLKIDQLMIRMRDREEPDLNPELHSFAIDAVAEVSADLARWTTLEPTWSGKGTIAVLNVPSDSPVRYVRISGPPRRIAEFEAYYQGRALDRTKWRASNLLESYRQREVHAAWSGSFVLNEIPKNAVLAVPIEGQYGDEGASAALRVKGELIGALDRAVSFPSNTWEYYNVKAKGNYTYYFALTPDMAGQTIEVVVLGFMPDAGAVKQAEAWLTAYPIPFESHELVLYE